MYMYVFVAVVQVLQVHMHVQICNSCGSKFPVQSSDMYNKANRTATLLRLAIYFALDF